MSAERQLKVVIVGAGPGGLAAAIELRKHGFRDVTLLERAPRLGGTWFYNSYPGSACDVPSHLYSFSFAQRRDWSRLCSPQGEILDYLDEVARKHGVDRLLVPNTQVDSCVWEEDRAGWRVSASDGREWRADAVVIATGQLHRPGIPRIAGAESFAGHTFHSAAWDHDYSMKGRRVAVIGTGASAVQLIPEVAREAEQLYVVQRSGNWLLPRRNRAYPKPVRTAIRYVPGLQRFRRRFVYEYGETLTAAIRHPHTLGRLAGYRSWAFMRWQLRGRAELRRRVWPDYTFGCKRVLFTSAYLPALRQDNVELVCEPVTGLTQSGILTDDGVERAVDCIVYATGFRTNDFMFPMRIVGRDGADLHDVWREGAHAHLGISVPGFPSMFLMYGPNTNTSGGSIILYEEAQAAYIRQALAWVQAQRADAIEVRPDVEAASDQALQERFHGTAWTACESWYREHGSGRIVANWPGYMREYEEAVRVLDPSDFSFVETGADREPVGTAAA